MIIAIDPGVYKCACACFDGHELEAVWFEAAQTFAPGKVPPRQGPRPAQPTTVVLVERPQFDGRSRTARVQDLMGLAWHGALVAGAFSARDGAPIVAVTPSEWKGSEPKPQHHGRLWDVLTPAERLILGGDRTFDVIVAARRKGALSRWSKPGASYYPKSFETHNLLDAVALGLWHTGRLEKR